MKTVKKFLRICLFVCFLLLAGLGIGLSGGVPVPTTGRKTDRENNPIELVDEKRDDEDGVSDFELR